MWGLLRVTPSEPLSGVVVIEDSGLDGGTANRRARQPKTSGLR